MPADTKTPEQEFDQLWGRVYNNLSVDLGDTYNTQQIVNIIHTKYPLQGKGEEGTPHPTNHILYDKMRERSLPVIRENIRTWIRSEIPPEAYITDEQEQEYRSQARGAYNQNRLRKAIHQMTLDATRNIVQITDENTPAKRKRIIESVDIQSHEIPEYDKVVDNAELTQGLASRAKGPRVARYRRKGLYERVLKALTQPRSTPEAAEYLQEQGIRTEVKKSTVGRDIRAFNLPIKGLVTVEKGRKYRLTEEGRRVLHRIQEAKP